MASQWNVHCSSVCVRCCFPIPHFAAWLKFLRETRCSKPSEWSTTFDSIMIIASAFKSNWTRGLRQLDAKHSPSFCGRRWVAKDATMCFNCMASSAAHLFSAKLYRIQNSILERFTIFSVKNLPYIACGEKLRSRQTFMFGHLIP